MEAMVRPSAALAPRLGTPVHYKQTVKGRVCTVAPVHYQQTVRERVCTGTPVHYEQTVRGEAPPGWMRW